jgi:hypothetical protein
MASIRSVLIRTCMANIQKEMSQLEHWLNNFGDDSRPETTHHTSSPGMSELFTAIEKLSGQMILQEHTLNNINDRLEILEETREVHIDNKYDDLPWVDNCCVPLNDELLSEEPVYTINKKSETDDASVKTPSIIPNVADDVSDIPDIDSDNNSITDIEIADTPQDIVTEKQEITVKNTDKILEKDNCVTETDVVKVKQVEIVVEDGIKLQELEYKGVTYYMDAEGFIYSVDTNEQPSKNPIGYWKEKTQTIAFYKTKSDTETDVVKVKQVEIVVEDGIKLQELEYKGVTYYMDAEGFIYSVDTNEQPSKNPIGYWKEKIQTIAFYKTKSDTDTDVVKVKQVDIVVEDDNTAEKEHIERKEQEDEGEKEEQEDEEQQEDEKEEDEQEEEDEEQEEQEEEQEEEDGIELEELEYKGVTYYRDAEGFIYSVDDDEQPSENPIGYWKEKTQTIAFYKTK